MATGVFSAKDVSHITKFKGDHLNFFKFQLKLVLKNHELLDIVKGTEPKPDAVILLGDNSNAADVTTRYALIAIWDKKDTAAQNYIVSTLEEKVIRTIMNCTSAQSMWQRLLNQYELSSVENKHLLMGKFMGYQFDPSHCIITHISTIESLAAQLADVKSPVSDDQIMAKITSTLPLSGDRNYRSFMSAWNSTEDSKKNISLLSSRLQVEENMLKLADLTVEENSDSAFLATKRQNIKSASSEGKTHSSKGPHTPRPVCEYCKTQKRRSANREEDCWIKQAYLKEKQDARNTDEAKIVSLPARTSKRDMSDDSYAFKSTEVHLKPDCWYADSGSSAHMTDQRQFFSSFNPLEIGERTIKGVGKDNEPLNVAGIGTVIVQSQVNEDHHEVILHQVLFVPNLGANLLSIGTATDRGCTAVFDETGVQLIKNGKTVATGSKVYKKLYLMDFVNKTSPGPDSALVAQHTKQSLQLWHERLGHVCHSRVERL